MSEAILNNRNNSFMEVLSTFLKSFFLVSVVLSFDKWYMFGAGLLYKDFPKLSFWLSDIKDVAGCLTAIGALLLILIKIRKELKNK